MTEFEATELEREQRPPRPGTLSQRSLMLLVAAAVILLDHVTKLLIEAWLPLHHSWAPVPELSHLFQFTHVTNTGAAFGLFPSGSLWFTVIAVIVSLAIVAYNYSLPAGHNLLRLALGLQLGGALGNLIDRLRLGHVTDFLDFGPWPVFNLADTAIVGGVVVLGILMLLETKAEREMRAQREAEQDDPPNLHSPISTPQSPISNRQSPLSNE